MTTAQKERIELGAALKMAEKARGCDACEHSETGKDDETICKLGGDIVGRAGDVSFGDDGKCSSWSFDGEAEDHFWFLVEGGHVDERDHDRLCQEYERSRGITVSERLRLLISPLTPDELEGLRASIEDEGVRDAIVVWPRPEGLVIVDGHNRHAITKDLGIECPTREKDFSDWLEAEIWIIENQLGRRNTSPLDKVRMLDELLRPRLEELARGRQGTRTDIQVNLPEGGQAQVRDQLAAKVGVSGKTYDALSRVSRDGAENLKQVVREKKIGASTAAEVATLPKEEQAQVVAKGEKEILETARKIRAEKAAARKEERKQEIKQAVWPDGKYRVIYADPPWSYGNSGLTHSAAQQYETMPLKDICALPVKDLATENAVLFMWATSPLLDEAFEVIRSWGFTYKSSFVWDKQRPVFGHYNRMQHEYLLVGVRGSCHPDGDRREPSVISMARDDRHSAKPDFFREMIDEMYPHGPRVELFSRSPADGWAAFGNEAADAA